MSSADSDPDSCRLVTQPCVAGHELRRITSSLFTEDVPPFDTEGFEEDVNPIPLLLCMEEVLQSRNDEIGSAHRLVELYGSSFMDDMKMDIAKADNLLKCSSQYMISFADTLEALRLTMAHTRDNITSRLEAEFKPFIPGDRSIPMTEEELVRFRRGNEVYHTLTAAATDLVKLERLSAQVQEASVRVMNEIRRVRQEAEQTRATLEAAEHQKEVERCRAEEKRLKQEEDARLVQERQRQRELEEELRRKRQAATLEHSREEEEKRQRKLEEEKEEMRRGDPTDWRILTYDLAPDDDDALGTGIGCLLRPPEGSIDKDDISVTVENQMTSTFKLNENHQLVSNIINIRTKSNETINFKFPAWVAMPNCSPRGVISRETVLKASTNGGPWAEVPTRDFGIPAYKDVRFVECSFEAIRQLSLAVITKPRDDRERVTNRGAKLVSTVDQRVCLVVPRNAVRFGTDLNLQVQPVDPSATAEVKLLQCPRLMASSSLVIIGVGGTFHKPLTVWMPNPGTKNNRPKTSLPGAGSRRRTLLPRPSSSRHSEGPKKDDGSVYLMWRSAEGEWTHLDTTELVHQRDVLSFSHRPKDKDERILLLKLSGNEHNLTEMVTYAKCLEKSIHNRVANVIVRQKADDMAMTYIEVTSCDRTEKTIQRLKEDGFNEGPQPSESIKLHEGQVIEVNFRGNVTFENSDAMRFVYNSNLATARRQMFLKEVDIFAQHGLDCFRGHAQFWTLSASQAEKNDGSKVEEFGKELLCELPVTLPKPPMKPPVLQKANFKIEDKGPLTREFLRQLAGDLGDEWRQVAEFLGVSPARVESIKRDHLAARSMEPVIFDVLRSWYKNANRNSDKVSDIYWALMSAQRDDLAEELRERNEQFMVEAAQNSEDTKMRKAFKVITDNFLALREWRELGRELGLPEASLEEVAHANTESVREQCLDMLGRWRDHRGRKASKGALVRALKSCRHLESAEKIKEIE